MGEGLDETAGLLETCGCAGEIGELAEKVWFGFLDEGFHCHFLFPFPSFFFFFAFLLYEFFNWVVEVHKCIPEKRGSLGYFYRG